MKGKSITLTISFFFLFVFTKAQDIMIKNDKTEMKVKLLEVLKTELKYKRWDLLDGPVYTIDKSEVFMVIYQNGQREFFSSNQPQVNPLQPQNTSTQTDQTNEENKNLKTVKSTVTVTTITRTVPGSNLTETETSNNNSSQKIDYQKNITSNNEKSHTNSYEIQNKIDRDTLKNTQSIIPDTQKESNVYLPTYSPEDNKRKTSINQNPPQTQPNNSSVNTPSVLPPQAKSFQQPTTATNNVGQVPPQSQPNNSSVNTPTVLPPQAKSFQQPTTATNNVGQVPPQSQPNNSSVNTPTVLPPQAKSFQQPTTATNNVGQVPQQSQPNNSSVNTPSVLPPQAKSFQQPTTATNNVGQVPPPSQPNNSSVNTPTVLPPQAKSFQQPTAATNNVGQVPPQSQPNNNSVNKPSALPPQAKSFQQPTNASNKTSQLIPQATVYQQPVVNTTPMPSASAVPISTSINNIQDATRYRRSSLYTIMIDNPGMPYSDDIKSAFSNSPVHDKFNDHNLSKRVFNSWELPLTAITPGEIINYKVFNDLAKEMVAKWFNRSADGSFDMELIKSRGMYDASAFDITTALASKRGLNILADAGEELISKTFVLVNDFKYTNKEEVAAVAKSFLSGLGSALSQYSGINATAYTDLASAGVTIAGKGYIVKTKAHLFQLVWNEEVASVFYNYLWADKTTITPEKKAAFEQADIFRLKYIGTDVSWADLQSSIYTKKSESQLVERATIKAVDKVIVKLQEEHDQFKTKTPLFTGDPVLSAKIGLKEGITNKTVFDVLELVQREDGTTEYVVVGAVKVNTSKPIWDNQYGAEEDNPNSQTDRTYFTKIRGKAFYPGMLLIQRNGK